MNRPSPEIHVDKLAQAVQALQELVAPAPLPWTTVLSWVGTIFGIAGATLVALNMPISGWGFMLFLVSSVSWTMTAIRQKDDALLFTNLAFIFCNLIGIWRWLIA